MGLRVVELMIGTLAQARDPREAAGAAFAAGIDAFDKQRPVIVLGHFDADGLSAAAIIVRALQHRGWAAVPMIIGKGETPWDDEVRARLEGLEPGGLILVDLGTPETVLPGCPTIIIDHHVPTGEPEGAFTISGNGLSPGPTSSLLAFWSVSGLGAQDDLLWLAAIGLIGDMAENAGFSELGLAQTRGGKTALKEAVSLINAPRRTAGADAGPALRLLLRVSGPKEITKGEDEDALALHAAKGEVRMAVDAAKRVPPLIVGDVALIQLNSACQIHPLIAQQWRSRLRDKVVIAANRGYREGWVHLAARSASGRNLIEFLAEHRPANADGRYGNGHAQATGGALRNEDWNAFITELGFPAS